MLVGIEFLVSVTAIAVGVALFVVALRRRPPVGIALDSDTAIGRIIGANLYALAVIALVFFGGAFLFDMVS